MAVNKLDKLRIELYNNNGLFMGYIKSVSVARGKIISVKEKINAKTYAKQETAIKDCILTDKIAKGALVTKIV